MAILALEGAEVVAATGEFIYYYFVKTGLI
jgi:hypothetical protein